MKLADSCRGQGYKERGVRIVGRLEKRTAQTDWVWDLPSRTSSSLGKRFPSSGNISRIANALEVKVADLFSEEPESMKVMASKKELKNKFEKLMGKAIDELFK